MAARRGGGGVVTKREEKAGKCILERRKVESKNSARLVAGHFGKRLVQLVGDGFEFFLLMHQFIL